LFFYATEWYGVGWQKQQQLPCGKDMRTLFARMVVSGPESFLQLLQNTSNFRPSACSALSISAVFRPVFPDTEGARA